MAFFLCKLIPPRASFAQDMTTAEAELIRAHANHWSELNRLGVAVVFGPVADPRGFRGLAMILPVWPQ
jgi:hypothetical protein